MLKLENISIQLKQINEEAKLLSIKELIDKIDAEIREAAAIYKPSDKKQIAAIKRYLKDIDNVRPLLKTWSPLIKEKKVAFTNSYSLYILNKDSLPFQVSFSADVTPEEQKNYIQEKNIDHSQLVSGCYPNVKNLIPEESLDTDLFKINVDKFLSWYKVQDKKRIKDRDLLYTLKNENVTVNYNPQYIKESIDILQLQDEFTIECYGSTKPGIIRNNSGLALILPIKKYNNEPEPEEEEKEIEVL